MISFITYFLSLSNISIFTPFTAQRFIFTIITCTLLTLSLSLSLLSRPTTYPYHIKIPDQLNYCLAFGTRRVTWPAAAIFCSTRNYMKCFHCQQQPDGDYYHNFKSKLDICRLCLNKELKRLRHCKTDDYNRKRKLREWSEFKLVRHCSFYHLHRSGKMTLKLMPTWDLNKKLKVENYLYPYNPVWDKRYI